MPMPIKVPDVFDLSMGQNVLNNQVSDYCRFKGYDAVSCKNRTTEDKNNRRLIIFTLQEAMNSRALAEAVDTPFFHGLITVSIVIYTIITVLCLLFSTIFVVLLLVNMKELTYSVYKLFLQIGVCYLLAAVCQLLINVPIYVGFDSDDGLTLQIPVYLQMIANAGALVFYTLLTLNRLIIFVIPSMKRVFDGFSLYVVILFGWLLTISVAIFFVLYGCTREFDIGTKTYYDRCYPKTIPLFVAYEVIYTTFNLLPVINLSAYVVIVISIFVQRNTGKINKAEIEFLSQSTAVLFIYTLTVVIFYLVQPNMEHGPVEIKFLFNVILNGMDVVLGVLCALTFGLANPSVRQAARKYWRKPPVVPAIMFQPASATSHGIPEARRKTF